MINNFHLHYDSFPSSLMFVLATSSKKFKDLVCSHQAESVELQCCRVLPGNSIIASYSVKCWQESGGGGGGKLLVSDCLQQVSCKLTDSIILTLRVRLGISVGWVVWPAAPTLEGSGVHGYGFGSLTHSSGIRGP